METLTILVERLAGIVGLLVPYPPIGEYPFLQRALLGLLLLAPLCAMVGIQVVNFRLAFFSEAVGHSVFTGIGLGLVLSLWTSLESDASRLILIQVSMIGFGVLVALGITLYRRSVSLPSDTVIGVFSATAVAVGLCVMGFLINTGRVPPQNIYQTLLAGNILTIRPVEIGILLVIFPVVVLLEYATFNRFLMVGLNPELAQTRGIHVAWYEYLFSVLLAVIVMFSIQWVGVLLVTALLVIPAAAARAMARSTAGMFWLAIVIALVGCVAGLILSDLLRTTTGATIILCMTTIFAVGSMLAQWRS